MIDLYNCKVIHYPYRTAQVVGRFLAVGSDDGDFWDDLHVQLTKIVGNNSPDNHECFELKNEMGDSLYVMFSDWKVYVGSDLVVKPW